MAKEELLKVGFYNNRFLKSSRIRINPENLALARGYAAFEFFRVINGHAFYSERHVERFFNTLSLLRIKIKYSKEQLHEIVEELIHQNEQQNFFFKIYALPGNSLNLEQSGKLLILPYKIEAPDDIIYEDGVCLLLKEYSRFLPEAKSTNYLASVYWQNEIEAAHASDVLYFTNSVVYECSRGNIFIVKNGQITTPSEKVLKGITKSIVEDIIQSKELSFSPKQISIDELLAADEVFITNTSKLIQPVVKINDVHIGKGTPGPISTELLRLFKLHLISWKSSLIANN